jgi:hypothetical protein
MVLGITVKRNNECIISIMINYSTILSFTPVIYCFATLFFN